MSNRYFKAPVETLVGDFTGTVYTEFKGEEPLRQATFSNGQWYTSRVDYIEGFGPTLLEGVLSELDLSETREISKEEFERVWKESE